MLKIKPESVKRMQRYDAENKEKMDLPLFAVNFPPSTKLRDLQEVRYLFRLRAGFRPFRPGNELVQCYRCMAWGRTAGRCNRTQRCVKCAKEHASKDCLSVTKETLREMLKCALCGATGLCTWLNTITRLQDYKDQQVLLNTSVNVEKTALNAAAPAFCTTKGHVK